MELVLLGLTQSGKTTLFTALTRGRVDAVTAAIREDPLIGMARVPDPRLDALTKLIKPKKVVPAEITYWDVQPSSKGSKSDGAIGGQHLNVLQKANALVLVVRAFQNPSVAHPSGSIDPQRDAKTLEEELTLWDLAILERRSERIQSSLKGARSQERDVLLREEALVQRVRERLEAEMLIREQQLSQEERRALSSFGLLTAKPLLRVINIDEADLPQKTQLEEEMLRSYEQTGVRGAAVCAKLEMELCQLSPEEEMEFRQSLGAEEGTIESLLRISYQLLGLVSFFTYASQEVRAWTTRGNTPAVQAAGLIHSDM